MTENSNSKTAEKNRKPINNYPHSNHLFEKTMILSLVSLLLAIAPGAIEACSDLASFRWNEDDFKSCDWVGRTKKRHSRMCQINRVALNCPQTCRTCCANDWKYKFIASSGQEKKCGWLKKVVRAKRYCDTVNKGAVVGNKCPVSCGLCAKGVADDTGFLPPPTKAPTKTTSPSVTASASPSAEPTKYSTPPTLITSASPSEDPTQVPSAYPSAEPTKLPSLSNYEEPSNQCQVVATLERSDILSDHLSAKKHGSGVGCDENETANYCYVTYEPSSRSELITIHNAAGGSFDFRVKPSNDMNQTISFAINDVEKLRQLKWVDDSKVIRMACNDGCVCSFLNVVF